MHNNAPTTERFKPAGHKAQELSEIVMPEETFKPIQRVVERKTDKTVGYLFRDVEDKKGRRGDIVFSRGALTDDTGDYLQKDTDDWKKYYNDPKNKLGWKAITMPLLLEALYRNEKTRSSISKMMTDDITKTLHDIPAIVLNERIEMTPESVKITRRGFRPITTARPNMEGWFLGEKEGITINSFCHAFFGPRHFETEKILSPYGSPTYVYLCPAPRVVAFGRSYDGTVIINTGFSEIFQRKSTTIGIAKFRNFPPDIYEVRDD